MFSGCNKDPYAVGTEGLVYQKIGDKEEYKVTKFEKRHDAINVVIPRKYQGLPVTTIGRNAFVTTYVTGVDIPDSVTTLETWAFYGAAYIESLKIPDSVTNIGSGAFEECRALKKIKLPKDLTYIDSSLFSYCDKLTNVEIPKNVTTIGSSAFYNTAITSIVIPDKVTAIGEKAFYTCNNFASVVIGSSVTSIGAWAFRNCASQFTVYYNGTLDAWNEISIGELNDSLNSATIYYYSEIQPTDVGKYWHYVKGKPTPWN